MESRSLDGIVDRFRSVRALVVGDIMLDRFQYGKVERISPEAPVPVFIPRRTVEAVGGAGNAAVNMAALGAKVRLFGRAGKDREAKRLSGILRGSGIRSVFYCREDCRTAVKTRLIAGNNHILRIDDETTLPLDGRTAALAAADIARALKDSDIAVISDYGKGFLVNGLLSKIIRACKKSGKCVLVDPKGRDYSKYAGATIVKPNLKEFSEAAGRRFDSSSPSFKSDLAAAAEDLMSSCGIEGLLITLSEHGMMFVPAGARGKAVYLPTKAREVFDVSGAGDTTVAALATALASGASVADAMQIANAAAGIVVGKVGTAAVGAGELKSSLSGTSAGPGRKILRADELKREIDGLKKAGRRIGFTNGCFDCCHLGHLSSLREAKSLCDVLVVGVNSDAWIRRRKGPGRPIQDEATRTGLIASLEYVDYVVVFDSPTALPIVKKIRPDVIAKEGYALKDWPEGRFVESTGGAAVVLKRVEGYSTTAIARKLSAGGRA